MAISQNIYYYNASAGFNAPDDGTPAALQSSSAYVRVYICVNILMCACMWVCLYTFVCMRVGIVCINIARAWNHLYNFVCTCVRVSFIYFCLCMRAGIIL